MQRCRAAAYIPHRFPVPHKHVSCNVSINLPGFTFNASMPLIRDLPICVLLRACCARAVYTIGDPRGHVLEWPKAVLVVTPKRRAIGVIGLVGFN